MHQVKINDTVYNAKDGITLSELLMENGITAPHPCGGRGICKKCTVTVNGKEELSCLYRIHSDIEVTLPSEEVILSETGAVDSMTTTERMCLVFDIGTTTLAMALVSQDNGQVIRHVTGTNPQRLYGSDIMNRISYCMQHGTEALTQALIAETNRMIATLYEPSVTHMYVAGNATMLHTFFGVDCSSMGTAPYTPAFLEGRTVAAAELGIEQIETVTSLPSISAFVGADLVAGLNAVDMPKQGNYSLLIDLGTNAEILLFSSDKILCTAAAAGPCFEGANISCGMSATEGAVYAYSQNGAKTIGDASPIGVCGTGLIDVIATLLESEEIDETGFMECESFPIADRITLEQKDVREFQLAKSAVHAAISTLMHLCGISPSDIEKMYISGGFSAKINIENAAKVGLLPQELIDRCVAIKNSCLLGTARYAAQGNDLSKFIEMAQYEDLSCNTVFSDLFIENMMF